MRQPQAQEHPLRFVVWDLDGTLVDSVADIAWALDALFAELSLAAIGEQRIRELVGGGAAQLVRRAFAEQGIEIEGTALAARTARFIDLYRGRPIGTTHLYPGIAAALERLRSAGVPQAVCTNKPADISEAILDGLGVRSFFAWVTGGDTTARRKPDPLPLEFTARCLGCRIDDGLMIGASEVDSGAARAAGMRVAIVDYGYSRVPSASIDCDFHVGEIEAFVGRLLELHHGPAEVCYPD